MIAMASKQKGGAGYGLWVGEDGLVIEGAVSSVVFVNDRNELVTPRTDFERSALEGTTLKRCDGGGGGGPR
jgi:branched-subunit amino acid aminotransferase/4-amino-4-deoxychorismate lyase